VLYGGWAGGDELGDLWVLKLGGLDDKVYRYSTAEQLPADPRREDLRRVPHEARGTNAALRMRLIQLVAAMQARVPPNNRAGILQTPQTQCKRSFLVAAMQARVFANLSKT
jgi:hypothetical protein